MSHSKVNEIYKKLCADISIDAIQIKEYGANRSEGYNFGYLMERLNDVLMEYGWNWKATFIAMDFIGDHPVYFKRDVVESFDKQGNKKIKETVSVHIKFVVEDEEGNVVWERNSFGGIHLLNNSLADSLKGAQTDAIKKALGYIGPGNSAFKGRIGDQLRHLTYKREEVNKLIRKHIESLVKEPTNSLVIRYVKHTLKKDYTEFQQILYSDLLILEEGLTKTEKEESVNAPPKPTRAKKAKTKATTKELDKPVEGDDVPPF